jgi:hypothetical protein
MPSLHELQSSVMHALLDGDAHLAAPLIAARGIAPKARLEIYANNARTNFIDSLKSSFPAIRRLVGEDYFLKAARGFHAGHPSRSGDLQPAGEAFAHHLAALHGDDEFRYLGEVARLEWRVQESLLAADHAALDLAKLGGIAAGDYDDLRFYLHPSARLFASQFPCLRIWEANVGSDVEPEMIDLGAGPDRVLLVRSGGQLQWHRLSHGELAFLESMQSGERFAAAVEAGARRSAAEAEAEAAAFDAAAAMQRFVPARAIVDFR